MLVDGVRGDEAEEASLAGVAEYFYVAVLARGAQFDLVFDAVEVILVGSLDREVFGLAASVADGDPDVRR